MKAFRKLCTAILLLMIGIAAFMNIGLYRSRQTFDGTYRVEAKRLADEIRETGSYDLTKYPHLTGVFTEQDGPLYQTDRQYVILEENGTRYRVEYDRGESIRNAFLFPNLALGFIALTAVALLFYIRRHIIMPFGRLNDVPKELAKGNLAVDIPEEKSRFFGKFTWGVNLLRESIEESREKEITQQRDKKLLLLSLSHDIKTPLSAIKLNAKALAKGLYQDEAKRLEAAERINTRADEIESFVSQITQAASQDFMDFEVVPGEVFLSVVIQKILARYVPQFAMSNTEFAVPKYEDAILVCDPDRLAECLQNLIENAIKYGDGKRIELRFDRMDGCELITVVNTGCSLEEKELPQIFESFHRGNNAAGVHGNGLGLFICKRLMSLMNGEVFAEIQDGCFQVTLVVRLA